MMTYRVAAWAFLFMGLVWFQIPLALGSAKIDGRTVEEAYPGLASGILKSAKLANLKNGVLLTAEGVRIDESTLTEMFKDEKPEIQEQLKKNLFFVLEQQAIQKILLHEAHKSGQKKGEPKDQVIMMYLDENISEVTVTDKEAKAFYDENKEMTGGMPFDQVKDAIHGYLLQRKKQEAVANFLQALGKGMDIRINREWVKKQDVLERDNPVDSARRSGKPTLVQFGATGCGPCDMMKPILADLKKKYKDRLNVVYINVGEQQILGARFDIRVIPVQAFFDNNGREVFRHVGFYPQTKIEKRLAAMGIS
ncbi:MAG: thioredoxin fold domain-containing protein [Deltaproteobacteria bacterium]|nr:thioredoxin fold domain-containing protein [Deltaproteobacteria bacterium]